MLEIGVHCLSCGCCWGGVSDLIPATQVQVSGQASTYPRSLALSLEGQECSTLPGAVGSVAPDGDQHWPSWEIFHLFSHLLKKISVNVLEESMVHSLAYRN